MTGRATCDVRWNDLVRHVCAGHRRETTVHRCECGSTLLPATDPRPFGKDTCGVCNGRFSIGDHTDGRCMATAAKDDYTVSGGAS